MNNFEKITIENGLKIFLLPDNSKHTTYINLIINYGGLDNILIDKKNKVKVINGMAHFIEHLVLEKNCYGDLMENFGKMGIRSNGLTSLNRTQFYIDTVDHIYDSLKVLIKGIHSPIINKGTVNKIKGPIIEEKRRSLDNKFSELYNKSLSYILNNKHFNSILGDFKDIENINHEDVEKCFKSFYVPSNEYIIIGGRFDKDKIVKTITETYKTFNFSKVPFYKIQKLNNNKKNIRKSITVKANTGIERVSITFKFNTASLSPYERINLDGYIFCFLKMNFGIMSELNTKFVEDEIIMDDIIYSNFVLDNFHFIRIEANTHKSEQFIKKILNYFNKHNFIFDEEIFDLTKKSFILSFVSRKDNVYSTVDPLIENICTFNYEEIDKISDIENSNFLEFKEYINKLSFDNYIIGKLKPL